MFHLALQIHKHTVLPSSHNSSSVYTNDSAYTNVSATVGEEHHCSPKFICVYSQSPCSVGVTVVLSVMLRLFSLHRLLHWLPAQPVVDMSVSHTLLPEDVGFVCVCETVCVVRERQLFSSLEKEPRLECVNRDYTSLETRGIEICI